MIAAQLALVCDWLTGMRGGEKCLEVLCEDFPHAPVATLLHIPRSVSPPIESRRIITSFLQHIPSIGKTYRYFLPLMPLAIRTVRLPKCDLVLSFSHAVAKSVPPPLGVPHLCYCFTPMRYAWHMKDSYFGNSRSLKSKVIDLILARIREWDRRTAAGVTSFVAISRTIQQRIRDCYDRDSIVIYPPVDTDFYTPDPTVNREDYYLAFSAFAPYKRLDLAIEACNRLKKKLVVIGTGQNAAQLKAIAGPTVTFLGWQSNEAIRQHLRKCRALLFPGEEDFGIVPVETNACGTPVICYAKGGATETINPLDSANPTGIWFPEQTVEALINAMEQCEKTHFDPKVLRTQALQFSKENYRQQMLQVIRKMLGS
jgi:glycosyltransferase involved in cell wall biosynthesis